MAIEDYTTYTETDEEGDLTVVAAQIDYSTIDKDVISHVIDDKGANHFGDFEHLVDVYLTSVPDGGTTTRRLGVWSIANSSHTLYGTNGQATNDDGFAVFWYANQSTYRRLYLWDWTDDSWDSTTDLSLGTWYYLVIERSGTTLTCDIYSDSDRTIWVDTLTTPCPTTQYRWMNAIASMDQSPGGAHITGVIKNLDLQEGVDVSAGIKIWNGAANIELVKDDTSPVKIRTPAATIGVKLVATGHADASAIRIRVDGATTKSFKKKV